MLVLEGGKMSKNVATITRQFLFEAAEDEEANMNF
jgi:hypothetical protein